MGGSGSRLCGLFLFLFVLYGFLDPLQQRHGSQGDSGPSATAQAEDEGSDLAAVFPDLGVRTPCTNQSRCPPFEFAPLGKHFAWPGCSTPCDGGFQQELEVREVQAASQTFSRFLWRFWQALVGSLQVGRWRHFHLFNSYASAVAESTAMGCFPSCHSAAGDAQTQKAFADAWRRQGKWWADEGQVQGEESLVSDPWAPPILPTPPALPPVASLAPESAEDSKLAKAIRDAVQQAGISLPPNIHEMLTKAEDGDGRHLTKSIHVHTTALGQARKHVRQIRLARAAQAKAWSQYIQATLDMLEKGAASHAERMSQLQAQEQQAIERATAAQKSIQQLSSDQVVNLEEDELDEEELVVDDSEAINQVSKRLKMTLNDLRDAMPADLQGEPDKKAPRGWRFRCSGWLYCIVAPQLGCTSLTCSPVWWSPVDVYAGRDQPHVEAPASWTSHEDWDYQLPLLHSCRHDSSYKSPLMAQLLACIWHWAVSVEEYDVLFDAAALFPCRFRGEWDAMDCEDCSFGSKDIAALLEGVPRPSVDTWSGARQCMDSLLPVEPSLWSPAGLEELRIAMYS